MWTDEVWTTRDGRCIPVEEMSESHVRNALRMLLRGRRLRTITWRRLQRQQALATCWGAWIIHERSRSGKKK